MRFVVFIIICIACGVLLSTYLRENPDGVTPAAAGQTDETAGQG